jgi:hypothetical protein
MGRAQMERPKRISRSHQLAFDNTLGTHLGKKMNRYNELKLQVLSLFASERGAWLEPSEAAERLDFLPPRSAWTYFKRLWKFGLLERRSSGIRPKGSKVSL